jgi:hypothetical protein
MPGMDCSKLEIRTLSFLVAIAGLGCGAEAKNSPPDDPTSDPTTSTGGETGASAEDDADDEEDDGNEGPLETGADPTTDPTAADSGEDDGGFVLRPDGGGANECDPRAQDCMRGMKCTAWANDGGTFWNANKCVEVTGEGVAGDPCMIEGSGVSGIDDCALGFICLNTDMRGMGTCVEFCEGTDETCEPGNVCAIYNDGVLPICLVGCDPLLQDCPEGQGCIDTPNQSFICFNDASGDMGGDGDPCPPEDGENSCDPGMWCGPNSAGCVDVNCCTPYCDITDGSCPQPDECVSFFGDPMNAPPGFENVGVCVTP